MRDDPPRPSTTVPTNDVIIDATTSSAQKHFESIHMNKLVAQNQMNEKSFAFDYNLMSLSEPD